MDEKHGETNAAHGKTGARSETHSRSDQAPGDTHSGLEISPCLDTAAGPGATREAVKRRRRDRRPGGRHANESQTPSGPHHTPMARNASTASDGIDEDLIQRYLAVVQQTTAANRVIGRLNFERDALARQVEMARTRGGLAAPASPAASALPAGLVPATPLGGPGAPQGQMSALVTLQRFLNEGDIRQVRMRRMGLVFGLLAIFAVGWAISQTGMVVFPAKLTRDSLGDLPFVGATLRFVMGVWSMFRVVRIGARGVRWAFPEDRARRRRR